MKTTMIPAEELHSKAIEVLCREIGVVNTIRFLTKLRPGTGDYTKERDETLGNPSIDEIIEEIKRRRTGESADGDREHEVAAT